MAIRPCRCRPGDPDCQVQLGNPRTQFWILSLTLASVGIIASYPPCSRIPFHDLSLHTRRVKGSMEGREIKSNRRYQKSVSCELFQIERQASETVSGIQNELYSSLCPRIELSGTSLHTGCLARYRGVMPPRFVPSIQPSTQQRTCQVPRSHRIPIFYDPGP